MIQPSQEFSFRNRAIALQRFNSETFDFLIIGGGITGAAVARDAVSRGLRVALVEKNDFSHGTSSRSSKLIHGGLRYLQNLEFGLVFEALSERAFLLKSAPHLVQPLLFYLPVYQQDQNNSLLLSMGLWLYDLLALFRAPGNHKRLSRSEILGQIPLLNQNGLTGGFQYYDASMWDDGLAIETMRAAHQSGAVVANYAEAVSPIWESGQICGFQIRDVETGTIQQVRAHRVISCVGPWTDVIGQTLQQRWKSWLSPSKGVHLIFELKKIPVPGAVVMSHPSDGRIAFVIPRPDFGEGVVIVGTTDGPSPKDPDQAFVEMNEIDYLIRLLNRYFPNLHLSKSDILSAYVGVRPLIQQSTMGLSLQKVSREHFIESGPGGITLVAGGKYTTHRTMAREILDFALDQWNKDFRSGYSSFFPRQIYPSETKKPVNPAAVNPGALMSNPLLAQVFRRYGEDYNLIMQFDSDVRKRGGYMPDPDGFPFLIGQLIYSLRKTMVFHLDDFYLRRVPLFSARRDHGMPWAETLAQILVAERGLDSSHINMELERLSVEIKARDAWRD